MTTPLIVMEMLSFENDLLPACQCKHPYAQRIERELLRHIVNFRQIGNDKVVSPWLEVPMAVDVQWFGLESHKTFSENSNGPGYAEEHAIKDLHEDLPKLQPSVLHYDREETQRQMNFATDVLGDLMPVRSVNESLQWFFGLSQKIVSLMGMEDMMYAFYDEPGDMRALYEFLCDDCISILRQQEALGILTMNNGNDYAGAGSYGFTHDLTASNPITSRDLWDNLNSQETLCISGDMYGEFAFPAYERLAREFGLVYYGCCEPVHPIWDQYIQKIPHLRKVSISPWCDEEIMGEMLRGSGIIYSRKSNPNVIGGGYAMDVDTYDAGIRKTLSLAQGCALEIIQRDIYTLNGNLEKPGKAVQLIRNAIADIWR